jgi:hypothetical protein
MKRLVIGPEFLVAVGQHRATLLGTFCLPSFDGLPPSETILAASSGEVLQRLAAPSKASAPKKSQN